MIIRMTQAEAREIGIALMFESPKADELQSAIVKAIQDAETTQGRQGRITIVVERDKL